MAEEEIASRLERIIKTLDEGATALFGLWSLVPYAIYLLVVFWLSVRMSLAGTLIWATLAWIVCAAAILLLWSRVYPTG